MKISDQITKSEAFKTGTIQLCSFWIASRLYGVNILDVKEISGNIEITPVSHAPKGVTGYMNIRGQILLVVDLRSLLGFETCKINENSRVILFKSTVDEPFGIIVDKIEDVFNVEASQVEIGDIIDNNQVTSENGISLDNQNIIVEAVCKLDKNLLVIINPKKILEYIEISQ
jgi:chemotaxis signal transduction protein